MKELVCSGTPTFWLTVGVNQGANVGGGMSQGFLRTLRSEQNVAKITLLDVDQDQDVRSVAAAALEKLQTVSTRDTGVDTEYWLHDDKILP